MEEGRIDERNQTIREFYGIYRRSQKKHNLRIHSRFSIYDDGLIEIWEYQGDKRTRNICKVKEESETECYKRATEALISYEKGQEKNRQ